MQDSKECFKCGSIKPLSEFYKHPGMFDGHLNKCKECNKKDIKENRKLRIDYYLEYDKQRANLPHRAAQRNEYQKTQRGREVKKKSRATWEGKENNKIKRACHIIFGNYMRGKERPNKCSECNSTGRICGHHDDYSKPLEVRWLCSKCHSLWHKINGEGKTA